MNDTALGRFEVFPDGKSWGWQKRDAGGDVVDTGKKCALRAEAITQARAARGDDREELFRADGQSVGSVVISRGPEALVLLREDGSVYGEIDHEVRGGGTPQSIAITPAEEANT